MGFDPEKHHRRSIRLPRYDYASAGWYYLTVCTHERHCIFGDVYDGTVRLSITGELVEVCWRWLASQYSYVVLDEYVIMPNHIHGIIKILDDAKRISASDQYRRKPIGRLLGAFKTVCTRRVNESQGVSGGLLWQRNYYERVIRDPDELNRIRRYIIENPARWDKDEENPGLSRRSD